MLSNNFKKLFKQIRNGYLMKEVKRPWGYFNEFVLNKKCTVKTLVLMPWQSLSLQIHKKRKENWYFLTPGYVQIRDKKQKVGKGEIVEIQKNMAHKIYAKNKKVEVLEISFGKFSENDEVRLEDKYGRK